MGGFFAEEICCLSKVKSSKVDIRFQNVVKKYGSTAAVKELNLTIQSGALHFLLGPSGCGKTTTLRMLAGLESVTSGSIFFGSKDVTKLAAADRGIGMVFQNYALWPHMTVLENIEYGLKLKKPKLEPKELIDRVAEVVDFTQLNQYVKRLPGQLSGGQQQRVALARALAIRPNVLLLDEPLSNLDAKLRSEMRDQITRIHRETKITTVYVTHDQKEALSMGTAVSVLNAGFLIQTDAPRQIYHHPVNSFVAGFVGETNLLPGMVETIDMKTITVKTDLGIFTSSVLRPGFAVGQNVDVSIRPEYFEISEKPNSTSENQFECVVKFVTYLGDHEHFHLNKNNTTVKALTFARTREIPEQSMVHVYVPSQKVLVLAASKEQVLRT